MPRPAQVTLSDAVYEKIRRRILSTEYELGHPLSRRRLAVEFEVSLIPISEALLRLEADGLVECRARVGTRVRMPSGQEVRGRYEVREALESQSARLFAQMATDRQKRQLLKMARQLDAKSEKAALNRGERGLHLEYEEEHMEFHMRIAECSGCAELMEAIARSRVLIFNWLFGVSTQLVATPPRWHQDLVDVLSLGDIGAADEAMRRHVRFRRDEMIQKVESFLAGARNHDRILRGPQLRTIERTQRENQRNGG